MSLCINLSGSWECSDICNSLSTVKNHPLKKRLLKSISTSYEIFLLKHKWQKRYFFNFYLIQNDNPTSTLTMQWTMYEYGYQFLV
jgi:hypothetical protein